MGTPREAKAAKYFVALLSSTRDILTHVESDLVHTMSEIDGRSEAMPWTASKFYEQEMGSGLLRRLLCTVETVGLEPAGARSLCVIATRNSPMVRSAGERKITRGREL